MNDTPADTTVLSRVSPPSFAPPPAHVPPELRWTRNADTFSEGFDDPFMAISELHRGGPPVIWAQGMSIGKMDGWMPVTHEAMTEVLLDTETFSSSDVFNTSGLLGVDWLMNPIEYDPPEHGKYRRILQWWFLPKAIAKLDEEIRRVARETIAKFEDDGRCEFISQFAKNLPTTIFLALLGLPQDRAESFLDLEEKFFRSPDADVRRAAGLKIMDALQEVIDDRRAHPRDDLPTALVTAEYDGRLLSDGEIMGMAFLMYIAGLDTVLSSSGWHMRYIATHPELQQWLRDHPEDIPGAVEDLIRAHGVLRSLRRVTKDVVFHGAPMKAGDLVIIAPMLAGRDPAKYDDPHTVRYDRNPRHLTFSTGPHICLGAHLARRELTVILQEFLARFSDIRIPAGETAPWQLDATWSIRRLPLQFHKAAQA